jgi:hypothetical protein
MNYKTTCPECGGNDYYVTPANGVGYCFHCAYYERNGAGQSQKEHVITHSIEEIRLFYKQATDYYHSCLSRKHEEYLVGRGLTLETIQRHKLGYIPNEPYPRKVEDSLKRDSGLYLGQVAILGGRISLPYLVNDLVTDVRGRDFDGDNSVKYKSPLGSTISRGAVYPYNYTDLHSERHVVTEGELKALVSSQYGVPAVALPGISGWRNMVISNNVQVIVFDSTKSRTARELTFKAVEKLAIRLKNPQIAFLPLRGSDKADLDSFILTHGIEEFKIIIGNALSYRDWAILQRRTHVY